MNVKNHMPLCDHVVSPECFEILDASPFIQRKLPDIAWKCQNKSLLVMKYFKVCKGRVKIGTVTM